MFKWLLFLSIFIANFAHSYCFKSAGAFYKIDPLLLMSIAIQESNLQPGSIGVNKTDDGRILSYDYGLMQINSRQLPMLKRAGIERDDLLLNPCLNTYVGAWVLRNHINRWGDTWDSIGSYNAGFSEKNVDKRINYASSVQKIYINLIKLNKDSNIIGRLQ
jgi:soluble lytic murein transglycosylase-like protein